MFLFNLVEQNFTLLPSPKKKTKTKTKQNKTNKKKHEFHNKEIESNQPETIVFVFR